MKQEDIDRLKDKLGDKYKVTAGYNCAVIELKDPWEGVEFVERIRKGNDINAILGEIKKLPDPFIGEYYSPLSYYPDYFQLVFKPSTESEYIDQLKKEAFERYGEIKEGDRFDSATGGEYTVKRYEGQKEFDYYKRFDQLFYRSVEIYQSGKWAKKLQERVEVEVKNRGWKNDSNGSYDFEFHFNVKNGGANTNMGDCSMFLSKQLEKYLNNEINE